MHISINTLGYTAVSDCSLIDDKQLVEEINKAESFSCTILNNDPIYELARTNKCSFVTVYDDADREVVFRGRIVRTNPQTEEANSTMSITCEGPLGYLRDSIVWGIYADNTKEDENGNVADNKVYFMDIISGFMVNHNYQVDTELQFDPIIHVHDDHTDTNDYGILKQSHAFDGVTTLEALQEVLEDLDWECLITYNQQLPHYSLHIAKRFGFNSPDPIMTGLNLKSLSETVDGSELITRIFPMGGVGYDEKRLTLTDYSLPCKLSFLDEMPEGTTGGDFYNASTGMYVNAYVDNDYLVSKWGIKMGVVTFDDIVANSAEERKEQRIALRAKAVEYAKSLSDVETDIDISAYDLSIARYDIGKLVFRNTYTIIDTASDRMVQARLSKREIDFEDLLNSNISFTVDSKNKETTVS